MTPNPPKFKSISPEHSKIILTYERLFLPISKEFFSTTFDEKINELKKIGNQRKREFHPDIYLLHLYSDVLHGPTVSNSEFKYEITQKINSELAFISQILGPGLYLNKSIDPTFEFPDSYNNFLSIWSELEEIKDKRKKKYKKIEKIRANIVKFYSREFFDKYDGGSQDISNISKREKLKIINENSITPLELLYAHCIEYSEMKNYAHVVKEAPYSAFALCWDRGEWVRGS
jgi:hypothetical protein